MAVYCEAFFLGKKLRGRNRCCYFRRGLVVAVQAPIGGVKIDLTKICKMIDGSGGAATCPGTYEDASSAFGGAASFTVSQMLAYASSRSNVGGTVWYGQVKAMQVLAKDAFDAINNQVAFSAP